MPASVTLIAGAGPTGLAAALFLTMRGLPVRIVERRTERSPLSKAFGINPRTMDLLEPTGVTAALLSSGRAMRKANLWQSGKRVGTLRIDRVRHRFPFMLVNTQSEVERQLEEALAQRGVKVERGCELVSIEHPDEPVATIRSAEGDERIAPARVLGADGAHSTVRQSLGIASAGTEFEEPWLLYDVRLDVPLAPDDAHAFLLDDGAMLAIRLRDDLWRLAGNVPDLLDRLPRPCAVLEERWKSEFRIAHRTADRMQLGQCFLAGDAAHVHSPFGARGMNLGIEDAYVFAKLASEDRLETFEDVRLPVVRRVVRRIEEITNIPRGRTALSRIVRRATPLFPLALLVAGGNIRTWLLGLDHDVE